MEIQNTRALKQYNRFIILNEIIENQPVARRDLTKKLDVSHATISYIVKDLIDDGLVVETEYLESTGGRPPRLLEFRGNGKFLIVVEISEFFIYYSIFDLNLQLISKDSLKTEDYTANEIADLLQMKVIQLLDDQQIDYQQLVGLGISTPGIYQEGIDRLTVSTSKVWEDVNIKSEFQQRFDLPVYIENDANLAAYYEWAYGSGQECSDLFYIFIADGIGGGFVINNQLYKGLHGKAGEIGHIKVKESGEKCDCGGHGCLETVSSPRAIRQEINRRIENGEKSYLLEQHQPPYRFEQIVKAYQAGDPLCIEVIDQALYYLVNALSSLVNIYDPGVLIIGDSYNFIDEQMIEKINKDLREICYPDMVEKLNIVRQSEHDNLQMRATAAFVFDRWKRLA